MDDFKIIEFPKKSKKDAKEDQSVLEHFLETVSSSLDYLTTADCTGFSITIPSTSGGLCVNFWLDAPTADQLIGALEVSQMRIIMASRDPL